MKIFVVTPYYHADPTWLRQAHESVRHQSVPAHHILVCDGGPVTDIPGFSGTHVVLPRNYLDYGNTPRLVGCYSAMVQGADAIAFLDADNWYQLAHLEGLSAFARDNNLDACASARLLHRLDGTLMMKCPVVDGQNFIDTNGLLVMRPAFHHLIGWTLSGQQEAAIANQQIWQRMIAAQARLGFLNRPTVCYRTRHATHYRMIGETPPPEACDRIDSNGALYAPPHTRFTPTAPA